MTTLYSNLRAQRPRKTAFKRRTYVSPTQRMHQAMQEVVLVPVDWARLDAAKIQFEASSELLAGAFKAVGHASDCAVHNAPALPVGPCDCGVWLKADRRYVAWLWCLARNQAARLARRARSWL